MGVWLTVNTMQIRIRMFDVTVVTHNDVLFMLKQFNRSTGADGMQGYARVCKDCLLPQHTYHSNKRNANTPKQSNHTAYPHLVHSNAPF